MNIEKLFDNETLENRINKLAIKIDNYFEGQDLTVLCVLKGSFMFTSQLIKKMNTNVELDFIKIHSYDNKQISDGNIELDFDCGNVEGKNILIVDDIVDTGYSLQYLINHLKEKGAKNIKSCALLNKESRRKVNIKADFIGFDIDDLFVLGYGLNYNQKYRNLDYIGYISDEKQKKI